MRLYMHACSGDKSKTWLKHLFMLSASLLVLLCGTTSVLAQNAQLVSVNKNGSDSGNGQSLNVSGSVSADGRFTVFVSKASDLTSSADGNAVDDVFVRDIKTGVTTLVSVNASGTGSGNAASGITNNATFFEPAIAISADGRSVAFCSVASDLVANDTNGKVDAFVRNLETGVTMLASINAAGTDSGNGTAFYPYLSEDGSIVGFRSTSNDLAPNDTNGREDVFVRNLKTGLTTLVSVNSAGTASASGQSSASTISADGRMVAFVSTAFDLVTNDNNGTSDIFVRDLQTGKTTLVSAIPGGTGSGNDQSIVPIISANGRFVVFDSRATNLVTQTDTNEALDVFVRDLTTGQTTLVSVNKAGTATGTGSNSYVALPSIISADGNFIAFLSEAPDLVDNDTNGTQGDVFVRDVGAGVTHLVSVNAAGTGSGNLPSGINAVGISADGRYVNFDSGASNLVTGFAIGQSQNVFVRDLKESQTTLVSVNHKRTGAGNTPSYSASLSADGSTAVFMSNASDLVANDTNNAIDVFAYILTRAACTYSISPASRTSPAAGETLTVNVATQAGCNWTAATNSNFINVTSGASGSGSGTVTLTIASNGSGVPRVGTATIAGQTLTITQPELVPEVPTIQFAQAGYRFSEGAGRAMLVITRAGDKSGTVSVQYKTIDDPAAVPCFTANGTAYARCDYATTIDTVTFAPGEERKEINIPLVDDAHVEGDETVQVALGQPTGVAVLATVSTATLTITDNDAAGAANLIFTTPFFVRQHYLDFLSREPEEGEPWSKVLNTCPVGDTHCDRITVSAAFFGSTEFRLKGFYVFIFYRVAFDRLPDYVEIIPDMRSVTGTTEPEVYAKRAAFPVSFSARQVFRMRYDALSNTAYVNALLDRYALQQITTRDPQQPEQASKVTLTRADLINRLGQTGTQALTRAQVLRAIVESDEVAAAEFNRAFVAMQYYGYLRRTPETGGYNDWLRVINQDPQNVRVMVNGFMNSSEYRLRFGQ